MLLKKKANTRFLVVGDGELREGLEQLVCRNGFSDKIIFDDSNNNKIENPAKGKTITEDEFQDINAKMYNEIRGK